MNHISIGAKKVWHAMASISMFFWVAGVFLLAMVVGTLAPQWNLYYQWWFIGLLGLLAANTVACVIHRWKVIQWPSLISHIGILLVLMGSTVTLIWGERGTISLLEGAPSVCGGRDAKNVESIHLPFHVRLKKFWLEYHGEPRHALHFTSHAEGWAKSVEGFEVGKTYPIENTPYTVTVKRFVPDFVIDMETRSIQSRSEEPRNPALLVAVNADPSKILPSKASPFRSTSSWHPGPGEGDHDEKADMMEAHGGRSPVSLKRTPKVSWPKEVWVFAKFPGMHQEGLPFELGYEFLPAMVKQFKSQLEVVNAEGKPLHEETIWVNRPMRYEGYTFYQSGYDPNQPGLSVVEAAKDPGVPIVYSGFSILMLGLSMNVLRRRVVPPVRSAAPDPEKDRGGSKKGPRREHT